MMKWHLWYFYCMMKWHLWYLYISWPSWSWRRPGPSCQCQWYRASSTAHGARCGRGCGLAPGPQRFVPCGCVSVTQRVRPGHPAWGPCPSEPACWGRPPYGPVVPVASPPVTHGGCAAPPHRRRAVNRAVAGGETRPHAGGGGVDPSRSSGGRPAKDRGGRGAAGLRP